MVLSLVPQRVLAAVTASPTVLLTIASVSAQSIPALPPTQTIEQLPRTEPVPSVEPIEQPEVMPPELTAPELPPANIPEIPSSDSTIFVSTFTFAGNTIFSDEKLQALAQPYLGRDVTFTDLIQLRTELTDLYVQAGYITSAVYLPLDANRSVDTSAANITLQILEGSAERIEVVGDRQLEAYVRKRIAPTTTPVNQSELEEALRLLQVDPLIRTISGNLSAGSRPGLSIFNIIVSGQPTFEIAVGTNNQRLPSVSSVQAQTSATISNLLGAGERISASYGLTEGSNTFDIQLGVPVNIENGELSFRYASIDGRIVEEPIDEFDIRTNSHLYTLSFNQPLVRKATGSVVEEFTVGVQATRVNSQATLSGFPFPLSPGANEDGTTRITELAVAQTYTRRSRSGALFANSEFNIGLDALNSTVGEDPDAQYITWEGQFAWLRQFSNSFELLLEGDIQLSGEPLIPFSQFSIGGPGSVRGYRQDALLADSGVSLAAELTFPVAKAREHELSLIPFGGIGVGWNNGRDRALDNNFLAAVGLGAQYTWTNFSARVNYAIPFTDVGRIGNSLQEQGIDFEVRYRLRF